MLTKTIVLSSTLTMVLASLLSKAELNPSITVGRCREIVVRRGAFGGNQQQPISFSVQECHRVHVEESAFSRVQRIVLSSVHQLELDAYAFRFSGAAASGTADISADITIQHATLEGKAAP